MRRLGINLERARYLFFIPLKIIDLLDFYQVLHEIIQVHCCHIYFKRSEYIDVFVDVEVVETIILRLGDIVVHFL